MLKKTYCYEYRSYFCHYGATPSIIEFDSLEEAKKNQARDFWLNDDGYVGDIFTKIEVVLSKDDINKRAKRAANKIVSKEFRWNAIFVCWDGKKEICYYDKEKCLLYFRSDKSFYDLRNFLGRSESVKVFADDFKSSEIIDNDYFINQYDYPF